MIEETADLEQSMRSAISAIDSSVVDKSALTFSIICGERCSPLRGICTILDAIPVSIPSSGRQTYLTIGRLERPPISGSFDRQVLWRTLRIMPIQHKQLKQASAFHAFLQVQLVVVGQYRPLLGLFKNVVRFEMHGPLRYRTASLAQRPLMHSDYRARTCCNHWS